MFRHKMMIPLLFLLLAFSFFLAGCGYVSDAAHNETGLTVNFIDVGQGDAIFIKYAGQATLIDTGDVEARDKLVSFLKSQGIKQIDNLFITHPHSDHIGGAAAVFDNFTVRRVFDSGQVTTSPIFTNYLKTIKKNGTQFEIVTASKTIELGDGLKLNILSPGEVYLKGTGADLNNNSIVAKLTYGNFSILFTGDVEREGEARLVKKYGAELKSTVLKAGHHGSRTSSSRSFLAAVNPETVVISVGVNNEYHHPHPSTIKKFSEMGMKIFRTDTDGTVTVISDGNTYKVSKEK